MDVTGWPQYYPEYPERHHNKSQTRQFLRRYHRHGCGWLTGVLVVKLRPIVRSQCVYSTSSEDNLLIFNVRNDPTIQIRDRAVICSYHTGIPDNMVVTG